MSKLKLNTTGGSGGSVALKGPASTTSDADVELTLPVDDGSADQYLKTNGSGVLSWATVAGGVDGISSSADATAITIDSSERVMIGTTSAENADSMLTIAETSGHCEVNILAKNDSGATLNFGDPEDYNIGRMKYNHAANEFTWDVNNTHRLSLESGGDLNIEDGNLKVASGHGIDFSATSDGTTMTSELLDDYEEGTWSPAWNTGSASSGMMSASAYESSTAGTYVKVGRLVTFTLNIECSSHTLRSGTHVILTGLPFSSENVYKSGGGTISYGTAVDEDNTGDVPTISAHPGAAYLAFYYSNGANFVADDDSTNWNARLSIHGHYFTA